MAGYLKSAVENSLGKKTPVQERARHTPWATRISAAQSPLNSSSFPFKTTDPMNSAEQDDAAGALYLDGSDRFLTTADLIVQDYIGSNRNRDQKDLQ